MRIVKKHSSRAFTLIELIIVVLLMSIALGIAAVRTGTYSFWKQESFIRQLSETLIFLHHQSVLDQAFYRIEFDLKNNSYKVGLIKAESDFRDNGLIATQDVGTLSLELASMLSPSIGNSHTIIPPPSFPSLAEDVQFPSGLRITDINTMRGVILATDDENPYILFSPRGFSEFAVIHIETSDGGVATILINPFSGNTSIYRVRKEFEWTYGTKKKRR